MNCSGRGFDIIDRGSSRVGIVRYQARTHIIIMRMRNGNENFPRKQKFVSSRQTWNFPLTNAQFRYRFLRSTSPNCERSVQAKHAVPHALDTGGRELYQSLGLADGAMTTEWSRSVVR